jgi:HSP20 family protein
MSVTFASEEMFGSMTRQMGKMLDQLSKGYYTFAPSETWTPNVNLYESERAYHVCVDLAGVEKEKIDIEVHRQRLTLKGTRTVPVAADSAPAATPQPAQPPGHESKRTRIHLMEIDRGAFARAVELPDDVLESQIKAEYRNGLLWIEIPKK